MLLASIKICQNCIPLPRFSILLESENSEIRIDYIATKCLKTKISLNLLFSIYTYLYHSMSWSSKQNKDSNVYKILIFLNNSWLGVLNFVKIFLETQNIE